MVAGGEKRPLKVFLCHASGDKPQVRALYKRLIVEGVDAWLDQEKLLPGQDWRVEIPRAVQESDVVVVCLSHNSITKEGYIQKEIRFALDAADEKPDGTIFLIPARIEDCPVPEKLGRWQWVDLFEENGYLRLLRSLQLRADKVGAVITPSGFVDDDEERDRRLEQYYTEGLAAFYTEDWDRASQRFRMILNERPNHRNAIEKLEEAERQRDLAKLYNRSMETYQGENWQEAIQVLEELLRKSPDYKDTARLLQHARKQKQLIELYSEAKQLHVAGKWQAVVKVFDQIFAVEPNHPDGEGLLASAQKGVDESRRLAELNDLYSRAVREMDAQKWREAKGLLERVRLEQPGFLETDRLLRKIDAEIAKIEERNRLNDQINILYEQAHGLLRSRNWRKALEKVEEIQKLDPDFGDKEKIGEKAKRELEREEQEAQKQNQLAVIYADAVRLLKDEKYEEALARWNEIKVIDPKYPDRQWVQRTVHKKISEAKRRLHTPNHQGILSRKTVLSIIVVLLILIALSAIFNTSFRSFLSNLQPRTEFPIQIKIYSTSDWSSLRLVTGGKLKDVSIASSSTQAEQARFDDVYFWLTQSLERANDSRNVEMVVSATLFDITSTTDLVFQINSGCIGRINVALWNMAKSPVLVKTMGWINPCDGSMATFEVPAELFME
jgi:outer membrane protein assembly factor BamD (BamD/ComL family)